MPLLLRAAILRERDRYPGLRRWRGHPVRGLPIAQPAQAPACHAERSLVSRHRCDYPRFRLGRCAPLLLLTLFAVLSASARQPSDRARQLGNRIKCMCGGCEDTASSCNHTGGAFAGPCATAQAEQKELGERLARGESDDLVLQDFVQEYGPQVLVVPPARGFNLAAWIAPVVVAFVGLLLALMVVRRWHRRAPGPAPAAPAPLLRPELVARARAETDREDY